MAFCESCGAPLADGAAFCESCGAAVAQAQTTQPRKVRTQHAQPLPDQPQPARPRSSAGSATGMPRPPAGSSIIQGEDGTYHWVFEYGLWRDPTAFLTILKVFVGVGVGVLLLVVILDIINGNFYLDDFVGKLRFGAIFLAVVCAFALVGYAIYAAINGGKYCVMFTMDEESIEHRQMPKQYEKAQIIGALNVTLGLATGNISQVGIGLNSAVSSMTSNFSNVRSIQGYPRRGVIKVNEPLAKNQVYVEPGDYDFVYGFICDRCPRAKVRG